MVEIASCSLWFEAMRPVFVGFPNNNKKPEVLTWHRIPGECGLPGMAG
jgi:hypothetical protein